MRKRFLVSAVFIIYMLALLPAASQAQIALGMDDDDRAEFARHREGLFRLLGDEVAVIFGAEGRGDNLLFRQDNRFYYLSGAEEPFAVLVLDGRKDRTILFLAVDPRRQASGYYAPGIGTGRDPAAAFGIAEVKPLKELPGTLEEMVPEGGQLYTVLTSCELIAGSQDAGEGVGRLPAALGWPDLQTREEGLRLGWRA